MNIDYLIDLVAARGMLDDQVAGEIRDEYARSGGAADPVEIFVNYGVIGEKETLYALIANELGTEYVDLEGFEPPQELLGMLPGGMARLHGALPISISGEGLFVALSDPLNPQIVEDLRFALEREIRVVVADPEIVDALIEKFYAND